MGKGILIGCAMVKILQLIIRLAWVTAIVAGVAYLITLTPGSSL